MNFLILKLIIISSSIGIICSNTSLLEKLKKFLLDKNITIIVKLLDCPLCSSFWCGMLLSVIFYPSEFLFISFSSALLGYFIGNNN